MHCAGTDFKKITMKNILFLITFLVTQIGFSASANITIQVVDILGNPIIDAEVKLKGKGTKLTDSTGIVTFNKVRPKGYTVEIKVDRKYRSATDYIETREEPSSYQIVLEWNSFGWKAELSKMGIQDREKRDSILNFTDFSEYDECIDTAGNHLFYPATFYGGHSILAAFINSNLDYPIEAIEKEEQGRVVVSFIIESNGFLSSVEVEKSISETLDAEAIRLVLLTDSYWVPASCNAFNVRTRARFPVIFKFTD